MMFFYEHFQIEREMPQAKYTRAKLRNWSAFPPIHLCFKNYVSKSFYQRRAELDIPYMSHVSRHMTCNYHTFCGTLL